MHEHITIDHIFETLASKAPEILTRQKIHELTGGLVTAKTLANMDSEGDGIQPRMRIRGKVCYPKDAVIAFFKSRCQLF